MTELHLVKYTAKERWLIYSIKDDNKGKIELELLDNFPDYNQAIRKLNLYKFIKNRTKEELEMIRGVRC